MKIDVIFQRLLRRSGPLSVHRELIRVYDLLIPDRLPSVLGNQRPKSFLAFSFLTELNNRRGILRPTKVPLHAVIDVPIVISKQWVVM